jgi:hypothetical protein
MRVHAGAGLAFLVFAAASVAAQSGSMSGRVRGPGGVPFRGAQVLIDDSVAATSGDSGQFMIAPIAKGVHTLLVRAIGFGPVQNLFHVDMGEKLVREFTLAVNVDTLAAVTIVGARGEKIPLRLQGFEDRRVRGQGHYIDRAGIDKQRDQPMSTVLRTMPGMSIKRAGGSSAFAINTRGGGTGCLVNIYLDGNLLSSNPPFDVNTLAANSLHGIEYYASGATIPSMYHRSGVEKCGVMLIWSK